MNEMPESMRKFRVCLDDAVSRGRRARADAGEVAERFQAHMIDEDDGDGAAPERDVSAAVANTEVEKSQEQTPSDGSDLDFSQAQIMH